MNGKVLKTLEYNKIIDRLESHADSESGKTLCRTLLPSSDIELIRTMQAETSSALSRILKNGNISFSSAYDLNIQLKRLELGGVLNASELLKVSALLENAALVKKYGKKDRNSTEDDCLDALFDSIVPVEKLSAEIRRCIIDENEISDSASPALSKIRRSIKNTEGRIHAQLNSMLNSSVRTYLQDSVITMRNGRYCIPVKSEYRSAVPGMIHDQSSSGSTVFIEPMAVIKLNNDIRQLEADEEKEIEAILASLSRDVFESSGIIKTNSELLIKLDFIFARASLALEMNAVEPVFNENGYINLKKARHPLIDRKTVVPTDIRIGDDFDLLIITGPNTGGKTVALKTIGLLTLMGQSGLHIPALSQSQLTVFDEIYADIGDEQSIEQSLSTFSSHMKNVISIIEQANERSFVLFDELGAGTDPVEGAALAQSVLEFLHKRHIRTIATTHYSELKLYALSAAGVENASCEFDVQTLKPTYRLLIGIPGKSNAFAISEKLGLPSHIIENAKTLIKEQDESFEDVISKLEKSRVELEREQDEIKRLKAEAENIRKNLETREKEFTEKRSDKIQKANEEAFAVLKEAKDYADSIMRLFQKSAASNPKVRELEKARDSLRDKMNKAAGGMSIQPEKQKAGKQLKPSDIQVGESVRVLSMNLKGTVSARPDSKGYVLVQMGIMSSKVHISDLEIIDEDGPTKPGFSKNSGGGKLKFSKSLTVSPEINLIGKTVDEAIAQLDKYLDDAYMAHLSEVRVVHGKGTGALRNGVHAFLKSLSTVKEFHLAAYGEGDAGVTIVKFK
ncbi:MAG TPA: endonuclease MutS2 [Candidatus Alectryocaccobium stercorigallinarum]|nr:endonuclease MutS2 [Candidatus Alectryocaccobium stercorigallinarum]